MRPERLTIAQAQRVYNDIVRNIKLTSWHGERLQLPPIDLAAIFNGRKSMTYYNLLDEINRVLEAENAE